MTAENTRIHQFRFGTCKESLRLTHDAVALLKENKVRVRLEAANINPSDLLSIHGVGQYQFNHQPPRVPGFEGVGHVIESNNADFLVGQKVVVATSGTWQKYIDVSPDDLFQIPEYLKNGYATQLYINALTAWVLITEVAQLSKEDVVIINAGCSAIGKIFAQLSLSMGYTVLVVTSNVDNYPYEAGYILDANDDLNLQIKKRNLPKPNIAFDAIGGKAGTELLHTLVHDGRFINYGTLSLTFYENHFFEYVKNQSIDFSTFFLGYWENAVGKKVRRQKFAMMLAHFITNEIKLNVDRYIALDDFQTALEIIESKSTLLNGKIILNLI